MSHTEGLLATNHDRIESKDDHGWINDGWIIAQCLGPDAVANARRLVACWNALEGISTEALEDFPLAINGVTNLAVLKQERDELLAALRTSTNGLRHCSRWNISEETEKAIITQVIANELILAKYKDAE